MAVADEVVVDEVMQLSRKTQAENGYLKRELELTKQVLWSVVKAIGGKVKVRYSIWEGADRDVNIRFSDDLYAGEIVIEALDGTFKETTPDQEDQ